MPESSISVPVPRKSSTRLQGVPEQGELHANSLKIASEEQSIHSILSRVEFLVAKLDEVSRSESLLTSISKPSNDTSSTPRTPTSVSLATSRDDAREKDRLTSSTDTDCQVGKAGDDHCLELPSTSTLALQKYQQLQSAVVNILRLVALKKTAQLYKDISASFFHLSSRFKAAVEQQGHNQELPALVEEVTQVGTLLQRWDSIRCLAFLQNKLQDKEPYFSMIRSLWGDDELNNLMTQVRSEIYKLFFHLARLLVECLEKAANLDVNEPAQSHYESSIGASNGAFFDKIMAACVAFFPVQAMLDSLEGSSISVTKSFKTTGSVRGNNQLILKAGQACFIQGQELICLVARARARRAASLACNGGSFESSEKAFIATYATDLAAWLPTFCGCYQYCVESLTNFNPGATSVTIATMSPSSGNWIKFGSEEATVQFYMSKFWQEFNAQQSPRLMHVCPKDLRVEEKLISLHGQCRNDNRSRPSEHCMNSQATLFTCWKEAEVSTATAEAEMLASMKQKEALNLPGAQKGVDIETLITRLKDIRILDEDLEDDHEHGSALEDEHGKVTTLFATPLSVTAYIKSVIEQTSLSPLDALGFSTAGIGSICNWASGVVRELSRVSTLKESPAGNSLVSEKLQRSIIMFHNFTAIVHELERFSCHSMSNVESFGNHSKDDIGTSPLGKGSRTGDEAVCGFQEVILKAVGLLEIETGKLIECIRLHGAQILEMLAEAHFDPALYAMDNVPGDNPTPFVEAAIKTCLFGVESILANISSKCSLRSLRTLIVALVNTLERTIVDSKVKFSMKGGAQLRTDLSFITKSAVLLGQLCRIDYHPVIQLEEVSRLQFLCSIVQAPAHQVEFQRRSQGGHLSESAMNSTGGTLSALQNLPDAKAVLDMRVRTKIPKRGGSSVAPDIGGASVSGSRKSKDTHTTGDGQA